MTQLLNEHSETTNQNNNRLLLLYIMSLVNTSSEGTELPLNGTKQFTICEHIFIYF